MEADRAAERVEACQRSPRRAGLDAEGEQLRDLQGKVQRVLAPEEAILWRQVRDEADPAGTGRGFRCGFKPLPAEPAQHFRRRHRCIPRDCLDGCCQRLACASPEGAPQLRDQQFRTRGGVVRQRVVAIEMLDPAPDLVERLQGQVHHFRRQRQSVLANRLEDVLRRMQHLRQRHGIEQPGRPLQGVHRAEQAIDRGLVPGRALKRQEVLTGLLQQVAGLGDELDEQLVHEPAWPARPLSIGPIRAATYSASRPGSTGLTR